jgi:hypothetical protein
MDSLLIVLAALACSLGMGAMGGATCLGGKVWPGPTERGDDKRQREPQPTG